MMSHEQFQSQVRSRDLAQLEESDITPIILRTLVAGRPFARPPFQGRAVSNLDLPCDWAQFLYTGRYMTTAERTQGKILDWVYNLLLLVLLQVMLSAHLSNSLKAIAKRFLVGHLCIRKQSCHSWVPGCFHLSAPTSPFLALPERQQRGRILHPKVIRVL